MKITRLLALALTLAVITLVSAQSYSYEAVAPEDIPFEATPI